MLRKSFVVAAVLIASWMNFSKINAAPRIKKVGQYRASSSSLIKFLKDHGFDFATRWNEFKHSEIVIDDLKVLIEQAFEYAAQQVNLKNGSTVWDLLVQCFGQSASEKKWIKSIIDANIANVNEQRKQVARESSKPYVKWDFCQNWAACSKPESAHVVFTAISEAICTFLEAQQESNEMPELWLIVSNLRAGKDFNLQVNCVIQPNRTRSVDSSDADDLVDDGSFNWYDHSEQESDDDDVYIYDLNNGDDLWNVVGQNMGWKPKIFLVATGVVAFVYSYANCC